MLAHNFQRKLRQLNKSLRIYCGNNETRPATIEWKRPYQEWEAVCAIDKNEVPEMPEVVGETGEIFKGGWRRAMDILIWKKLVSKNKAEILFSTQFGKPELYRWKQKASDLELAERDADARGAALSLKRFGKVIPHFHLLEDDVELARLMRKKGMISYE